MRDCRREGRRLGDDTCCGRLVLPISNTVGGWARRSKTAASGRAASITTRRVGAGSARQQPMEIQHSSLAWTAVEFQGFISRPIQTPGWQSNPVWGLDGPAYKALEFYSGPGQTGMLNFHWLLEREAVADERSGSLDADTLRYSSSWRGHWPADWGWVALWDAEFLLAKRSSVVTGAAERGAEL